MKNYIGRKVLITTNNWFYAPNGQSYRAVWGTLEAIHEAGAALGFIPNRAHANWFIEVGSMIVMGCQVMYLIQCDEMPNTGKAPSYQADAANGVVDVELPSAIYIAE